MLSFSLCQWEVHEMNNCNADMLTRQAEETIDRGRFIKKIRKSKKKERTKQKAARK